MRITPLSSRPVTVVMSALMCFALGCGDSGPPKVSVNGKLLNANQALNPKGPLPPGVEHGVSIQFYPSEGGDPYATVISKDGTFTIGESRGGVPAGKYNAVVIVEDIQTGNDLFRDRYADPQSSGLSYDIKEDGQVIEIDFDKLTGK